MSNFHLGQKVVCIDDGLWPDEPPPYVVKGHIYTISGFEESPAWPGNIFLTFEEFPFVCAAPGWTTGYLSTCFRPVRTTDISIFTAMLVPAPREKVSS